MTAAGATATNGYELLLNVPYDDPTMDPAGNPHDAATELPTLQIPSGISAITWNVTEWTNTDGLDNDGDGNTDEDDELNIKNVTLNVSYNDRQAKTLTINFYKTEMF